MSLTVLEYLRSADGIWSLPPHLVEELRAAFTTVTFISPGDRSAAEAALPVADVVLGWAVRAENFTRAERLRWIHVTAAGIGPMLFPQLVESDVVVTNGRGIHAVSMAEHALGVMLMFARKLHLARDAQHRRAWTQDALWSEPPPFRELGGSTLGLIGLGAVNSALAERARALGMRVIAVRRHPERGAPNGVEAWSTERLDELLALADWLTLAPPLTPETRGMLDARRLALLKPEAFLINLGRGALIDERALTDALLKGRIAGAALDVFEDEPLSPTSPLWRLPQVILTPHVSGFGPRYWERSMELFRRNLTAWLEHRPLENVVDKRAGY